MERSADVEEERGLLDDEPVADRIGFLEFSLWRRHRRRCRLFLVPWIFVFTVSVFVFLSYQFLKPPKWRLVNSPEASSSVHEPEDDSLAIQLNPSSHRYRPPRTFEYNWTISTGIRAPDGVEKQVYLINNQFPGALIEARSGDTLIIHVFNNLTSSSDSSLSDVSDLSIHWHGPHMPNANQMDGVPYLTQLPIQPNSTFVYNFTLSPSQCGTFWYHAHSQLQRAEGLYGGLVIHCPATHEQHQVPSKLSTTTTPVSSLPSRSSMSSYSDEDIPESLLLIGDWYHRPASAVLAWYDHWRSFGNEPVPDSMVINNGGKYNCSNAAPARPITCNTNKPLPCVLALKRNQPSRLRVANVGSLAGFTLRAIGGVSMLPIAFDGGNKIEGKEARAVGMLYPGERVDLIVTPQLDPSTEDDTIESSLEITLDPENFLYGNPALTPNQSFPISISSNSSTSRQASSSLSSPQQHLSSPSPILSHFNLQLASSLSAHPSSPLILPLPSPNHTFSLYASTPLYAHHSNRPLGMLNHSSYLPSSAFNLSNTHPVTQTSSLQPLISTLRASWPSPSSLLIPHLSPGAWVSLTINNLDDGGHPFHLHGHDFYVLRTYPPSTSTSTLHEDEEGVEKGGTGTGTSKGTSKGKGRKRVGSSSYNPWTGKIAGQPTMTQRVEEWLGALQVDSEGEIGRYSSGNSEGQTGKLRSGNKDRNKGLWDLRPRKKDTVFVPRKGHVVLLFQAQESGRGGRGGEGEGEEVGKSVEKSLWAMHCHVLWHQAVGMGMAWEVSSDNEEEDGT